MRFADLPSEVQEALKSCDARDIQLLAVAAQREADNDRLAELSTDPGEAIKAAFSLRTRKLCLDVDDPLEFIEGAIELARSLLGHEDADDCTHRAMCEILTAANDVLHLFRQRDRAVQEHLRAAWLKLREV